MHFSNKEVLLNAGADEKLVRMGADITAAPTDVKDSGRAQLSAGWIASRRFVRASPARMCVMFRHGYRDILTHPEGGPPCNMAVQHDCAA